MSPVDRARAALAAREELPYDEAGAEVPWDHLRDALAEVDRLTVRLAAAEKCATLFARCDDADFCVCGMPEGQADIRAWRALCSSS